MAKSVLDALKDHPWAAVLVVVSGLAAGLQDVRSALVAIFGTTYFVADFVVVATIVVMLIALLMPWIDRAARAVASWWRERRPSTKRAKSERGRAREGDAMSGATMALRVVAAALLLGLCVVHAPMPVAHVGDLATTEPWRVCGIVENKCSVRACVALLDQRQRPVSNDCYRFGDDFGYIDVPRASWAAYEPAYLTVKCASSESAPWPLQGTRLLGLACAGRLNTLR